MRRPPSPLLLGAGLLLMATNLRAAVTSLGPVLQEAVAATGLSPAGASLLTTLPTLCFALVAPAAPLFARRLGMERALLAAMLLLAAGAALRGVPDRVALFGGQVLACVAIGLVNVLLPGLVKRDFPGHVARMTGLYTMAFCLGAAGAAGATVPLASALGSWSLALAVWALPAVLAAAVWAPLLPPAEEGARPARRAARALWTDPLAWQVTLFMGLQSALAYIVFGWLPALLRDRGLTAAAAGLVLSVSVVAQAAGALAAPALAVRGRDQRLANVAAVALTLGGLLGCFYAPLRWAWGCGVVLGLGQGALIALALTIIVLRSPDPWAAASLSGTAQGVGYLLASAGPMLAGLLRARGGWDGVALLSVAISGGAMAAGLGAGRARLLGAERG